jgi:hypothetical protein
MKTVLKELIYEGNVYPKGGKINTDNMSKDLIMFLEDNNYIEKIK